MSKYGLNLNKIKNNFRKYQTKTDDKVYSGGIPNFLGLNKIKNKLGQYKGADADKKYLPKAQKFKNNYANKLKKYMNIGGNTTTNTNNSENDNINKNDDNTTAITSDVGEKTTTSRKQM